MENAEVKASINEETAVSEQEAVVNEAVQETVQEPVSETAPAAQEETAAEASQPAAEEKAEEPKQEIAQDTMEAAIAMMDNKSQKFRLHQIITATISQAQDDGLALYIPNTKKEVLLDKNEMLGEYKKEDFTDKVGDDIDVMVVALTPHLKLSQRAMEELQKDQYESGGTLFPSEKLRFRQCA